MSDSTPTAQTAGSDPAPAAFWRRAGIVALLFGLIAFGLFTRHNDFPFYYHTDEPGKVKQVITGERNFHHPLLLLESTDLLLAATRAPHEPQAIVEAGRTVSAFYAAVAVAGLMLLAWHFGGPLAGLLTGVLLATHPVLFELSHYMKEDCSLLAGVAVSFLAMRLYSTRPTLAGAALAGAAAGLAISGKLIGVAVAGVTLVVVLLTPRNGRRGDWKAALLFFACLALVVGAVNFDAFRKHSRIESGLTNEIDRIDKRTDERAGTFEVKYVSKIYRVISAPLLLGAAFWAWRRWKERQSKDCACWALVGFPLLFGAVLSVAPVTKERYMLPVFVLFCVLGALGLAEAFRRPPFRHARLLAGLLMAVAVGWHLPKLVTYYREFGVDDRREMIAWIREHLPADAVIAHDKRARLDTAQRDGQPVDHFPQQVRPAKPRVCDLGTIDELKAQGVGYVAVCELDYHTALRPDAKGQDRKGKEFYERLFRDGKLLWEREDGRILYIHPGLRLYQMP